MIRTEAIPFIFESLPYIITIVFMAFSIKINDRNVISLKNNLNYLWHTIYILFIVIWVTGIFGSFNNAVPGADKLVSSYAFSAAFGHIFFRKVTKNQQK